MISAACMTTNYRASEIESPLTRATWFVLCSAGGTSASLLESQKPRLPGLCWFTGGNISATRCLHQSLDPLSSKRRI